MYDKKECGTESAMVTHFLPPLSTLTRHIPLKSVKPIGNYILFIIIFFFRHRRRCCCFRHCRHFAKLRKVIRAAYIQFYRIHGSK